MTDLDSQSIYIYIESCKWWDIRHISLGFYWIFFFHQLRNQQCLGMSQGLVAEIEILETGTSQKRLRYEDFGCGVQFFDIWTSSTPYKGPDHQPRNAIFAMFWNWLYQRLEMCRDALDCDIALSPVPLTPCPAPHQNPYIPILAPSACSFLWAAKVKRWYVVHW